MFYLFLNSVLQNTMLLQSNTQVKKKILEYSLRNLISYFYLSIHLLYNLFLTFSIRFMNYISHYVLIVLLFSQALNGFIIMMTQGGKLLFVSDNAAEYLGHSMVSEIPLK